jgi:hypothetical protein
MNISAYTALVVTLMWARPLTAAESVPFDICAESTTWTRPAPEVQTKIWNDPRYTDFARNAYEWTHNFLVTEPDSASIAYHLMNVSGLWTAASEAFNKCPEKTGPNGYQWIEIWVLLHRVREVTHDANTYTITVEPTGKGFQSVFIRRMNPSTVLRFVTPDGRELERWDESDRPDKPHAEVPPGRRIIGPNGEIIRK